MPACWNAHITSPEQSKPPGAAPPHEYGVPIWVKASCTTTPRSPSPPGGEKKGKPGSPPGGGASPGAGAPAGGAPGGNATGADPGAAATWAVTPSGTCPGSASAVRCSGVSAWYCVLTTAICTCSWLCLCCRLARTAAACSAAALASAADLRGFGGGLVFGVLRVRGPLGPQLGVQVELRAMHRFGGLLGLPG